MPACVGSRGALLAAAAAAAAAVVVRGQGVINVSPSDNWEAILETDQPAGTEVVLAAGTYTITSKLGVAQTLGTVAQPVVIRGMPGARIDRPNANQNLMDIGGQNFVLANLELTGGSRGVRVGEGRGCSNCVFENLTISGTANSALTFNDGGDVYDGVVVRGCEIFNTGSAESEAIYAGCNNDGCQFRNGLIEKNYLHDTQSATAGQGDGIDLKSGSSGNIIRFNTIARTRGPGILCYDSYGRGRNEIYNNVVYDTGDNGIQASAGATIRNNIVVDAAATAISIAQNQLQPGQVGRELTVIHNTVINGAGSDGCLRANGLDAAGVANVILCNNVLVCDSTPAFRGAVGSGVVASHNAYSTGGGDSWTSSQSPVLSGGATIFEGGSGMTPPFNFYPVPMSPVLGIGAPGLLNAAVDDFDCEPRVLPLDAGAYQVTTPTNPNTPVVVNAVRQLSAQCRGAAGNTPSSPPSSPNTPPSSPTPPASNEPVGSTAAAAHAATPAAAVTLLLAAVVLLVSSM